MYNSKYIYDNDNNLAPYEKDIWNKFLTHVGDYIKYNYPFLQQYCSNYGIQITEETRKDLSLWNGIIHFNEGIQKHFRCIIFNSNNRCYNFSNCFLTKVFNFIADNFKYEHIEDKNWFGPKYGHIMLKFQQYLEHLKENDPVRFELMRKKAELFYKYEVRCLMQRQVNNYVDDDFISKVNCNLSIKSFIETSQNIKILADKEKKEYLIDELGNYPNACITLIKNLTNYIIDKDKESNIDSMLIAILLLSNLQQHQKDVFVEVEQQLDCLKMQIQNKQTFNKLSELNKIVLDKEINNATINNNSIDCQKYIQSSVFITNEEKSEYNNKLQRAIKEASSQQQTQLTFNNY